MGATAVTAKSTETKQREALAAIEIAPDAVQLKQACGAGAGLPRFLGGGSCGCGDCNSGVQAKLVVGTEGDSFEREADRIAEAVSRPFESHRQTRVEPASLRTPTRVASGIRPADSGSPMPTDLRDQIEPLVGSSLGHVRVHDSAADRELARGLQAKAFTQGSHIWLGPSQSSSDAKLMAHEATHVAQQGAGGRGAPDVQRLADDSAATKPSPVILQGILKELPASDAQSGADVAQPGAATSGPKKPHRAEYLQKKNELLSRGKPAVDVANSAQPRLERAADQVKKNSRAPANPAKAAPGGPQKVGAKSGDKGNGKGAGGGARKHARIAPLPPPTAPALVQPPKIESPKDSGGQPLMPDPGGDAQILKLAAMAQLMRTQGFVLRQRAAQEHHNASVIQANMAKIQDGVSQADEGIGKSQDHLSYRREVSGHTHDALMISAQKADMVATKVPDFQAKSAEGMAKSGPMNTEAKGLAKENSANTPDDDDAGEESQEQGEKINKVGTDIGTMNDAMGKTAAKADSLAADAAHAKEGNQKTQQNLTGTQVALDHTDAKLKALSAQSAHAQNQIDAQAAGPHAVAARAASLDQQGEAAISASVQLEQRIHAAQQRYAAGMRNVPKSKRGEHAGAGGVPLLVQRQADPGATPTDGRVNLNLAGKVGEALPDWLTGEERQSDKERAEAQAAEKKRRADEIAEINTKAGGDFSNLSAADKAGIALSLTARHLFGSVAGIKWPNFLHKMAQGLVDPRMALMGVVSGLSMVLSGGANLLSAEQWQKDPLGNLLKSAADIASGITIILGSITALAMAIIAILVAAAIFSLGALGPVAAAVIPFCWTVVGTVGPWTITAAAIALELNAMLLIKDLVDAATADTADKLEDESDKVTEDAKNAGNMALQIGMAAVGEAGGGALASTEFGQGLASGMRDIGEEFGMVKPAAPAAPVAPEALPAAPDAAPAPKGPEPVSATPESAPTTPEAKAAEGKPTTDPAASGEVPKAELEDGIVAKQPTVEGHTVKVNEAGECLVCSDCIKLSDSVDADLAASEVSPATKAKIDAEVRDVNAIEDPSAKATAGAEVKAQAVQAAESAPPRRGTVSADGKNLVEHPISTPEVEIAPPRRGVGSKPAVSATPDVPERPFAEAPSARGSTRQDIADVMQEQTATTEEVDRGEYEAGADDVREAPHPRMSEQTTGPERARAAAELEARGGPAADEDSGSQLPDESREGNLFDDPNAQPPTALYARPSGFPPGFREEVWAAAADSDGIVRDPLTNKPMDPSEPWHMGHKPEQEFWRFQREAAAKGMSREQFLREYYETDKFRPELPESNISHEGESKEPYDGL